MSAPDGGRRRVVVVGGGVAGLVAARELASAGADDVLLLEAGEHLGGCVAALDLTPRDGGAALRVDAGADSFATRTSAVADLLADLGLGDDVVTPRAGGAWVRLPDRTVPLPRAGLLGIPGSPWSPEVRAAIGVRGALRASLDRVLPGTTALGGTGPVSLGELVRRRLGRRVLERLVAPVVTGVHSAHPDDVDLEAVLPGVATRLRAHGARPGSLSATVAGLRAAAPAGSAVAGLRGGMHGLAAALADDVRRRGVRVRLGTPVTALRHDVGGTWHLTLAGRAGGGVTEGTGEEVVADAVVLAVPGAVASRLLAGLVPEVDGIGGPTGPTVDTGVVLATLLLDAPALDAAPRGTGVLVADDAPGVRAKALTHATAKWHWLAEAAGPGRHVVRLSYGRAAGGPDDDVPADAELADVARADAAALLGVPLAPEQVLATARTAWAGGLPHARPGHRERVAAVRRAIAAEPGLWACGAWLAGTGLAAVVADARATGAAAADERAA